MSGPVYYHEGKFPPTALDWERLVPLIGPANAAVARYDGILAAIPNTEVLLSPLTMQEATISSRIEGTQASMGEVLEYEAEGKSKEPQSPKDTDILEIINYRKAMRQATEQLKEMPLCQRIVLECHRTLLDSVRGHGKAPGEYRKAPNWIGPKGCSIEEARYVPISAEKIPDAISRWEKYLHEDFPDPLVQLALIHAEFEALHPFLDGNGRLGRMLIPIHLYQRKIIRQPVFYISAYLLNHRDEYYERLLAISRDNDWNGWCSFFLTAIRVQAEGNIGKCEAILHLYNKLKHRTVDLTQSQYAILTLDWIFKKPILKSSDFKNVDISGIPKSSARRILKSLKDEGILKELRLSSGRRSAMYANTELLSIVE